MAYDLNNELILSIVKEACLKHRKAIDFKLGNNTKMMTLTLMALLIDYVNEIKKAIATSC
jgi:hypothetical protein